MDSTAPGMGVDESPLSPLHTLGLGHTQAAAGDHGTHHLEGVTLTGSRAAGAALVSVIAALVSLGATDSTTV